MKDSTTCGIDGSKFPIRMNHIRLFVTIEKTSNDLASTKIQYNRFVYGFDPDLLTTIEQILVDLRNKLFVEDIANKLELYLRHSDNYFLPTWAYSNDVLRSDDEVILRIYGTSFNGSELSKNEEIEDTEKRRKKKRKFDREEPITKPIFHNQFTSALSNDIGKELDVVEADVSIPKKEKRCKRKKIKENDDSQRDFIPLMSSKASTETDMVNEVLREMTIRPTKELVQDVPNVDRPTRKKRTKHGRTVYDKAVVIRNGDSGKIQHVYFDSSSESSSEAEETVKAKEQNRHIPAQKSENLTSKVLSKAKTFTALIDHQTVCENLESIINSSNNNTGTPSVGKSGEHTGVPVLITKKRQQHQKRGRRSGEHYANASIIIQRATESTIQTSTPIGLSSTVEGQKSQILAKDLALPTVADTNGHDMHNDNNDSLTLENSCGQNNAPLDGMINSSICSNVWFSQPVETYSLVKHGAGLRIGDRIAYKVMELDPVDCTPKVSDWKIGELIEFDIEELRLRLKLLAGEARCNVPYKFQLVFEDGDAELEKSHEIDNQSCEKEKDQEDVVFWTEIIEARLLNDK